MKMILTFITQFSEENGESKLTSEEIVVYLTSLCVNWAFFGTRGLLKRSFHSRFKMAHSCQKRPNLHTNELNTTFFCSTSPLKTPNRLKPLKLA
jgi:hypothetical protein